MKRSFVCESPKTVYLTGSAEMVRCWKCTGCRSLRAWLKSLRIHLEALGHKDRVWLCTLTFREETDDDQGYPCVQKWLKLVRKQLDKKAGEKLRYTCVPELGSRNRRLHYHVVVYSTASLTWRTLNQWQHGFSHYKLASGRLAVAYVLKYLSKGRGGR